MRDHGYTRAEPGQEAERRWTAHVAKMYEIMLMRKAKSWFTGYNSNVAGHEEGKVRYFVYNGGTPKYVEIINDVAARGYEGIVLSAIKPRGADDALAKLGRKAG
jgi:ABC-type sugar transport system substrate-binding protein